MTLVPLGVKVKIMIVVSKSLARVQLNLHKDLHQGNVLGFKSSILPVTLWCVYEVFSSKVKYFGLVT